MIKHNFDQLKFDQVIVFRLGDDRKRQHCNLDFNIYFLKMIIQKHYSIIDVTIGRVLFSDPIAFVDVVIRRNYFNLLVFCFTWL